MKNLFRLILGDRGERAAVRYLKQQGMKILERRSRTWFGEIDIIALDGSWIVFVEVKTRTTREQGQPFEAVDARKQKTIIRAALSWLKKKGQLNRNSRFDIVSIIWSDADAPPEIHHFRQAFEPTDRGQFFS